ncbi:MAG: hypothetical protein V7634_2842 [Bradyrhizobium sp.]|jgi:hypothetical protein
MMRTGLFTIRNFNMMLTGMAFLAVLPTASHAFTEDDQRRLCTGDVFRLCSSEIPDRDRIVACMHRQRASLSDGCRSVFGRPSERSASASGSAR